jgi:hypothetical protein
MRLNTDPPRAEVYAGDGALIGNTPLELPRPAEGQTTVVTIRMPGYQDRSFTISPLTASEVTVRLERARTATSGGRRPTPQPIFTPTPQPLGPVPSRPTRPSLDTEIIDPF